MLWPYKGVGLHTCRGWLDFRPREWRMTGTHTYTHTQRDRRTSWSWVLSVKGHLNTVHDPSTCCFFLNLITPKWTSLPFRPFVPAWKKMLLFSTLCPSSQLYSSFVIPIYYLSTTHSHHGSLSLPQLLRHKDKWASSCYLQSLYHQHEIRTESPTQVIWTKDKLTASTRPFSVGFFSMRASNTSSVSLRTYSRTVWERKEEEAGRRQCNVGMLVTKKKLLETNLTGSRAAFLSEIIFFFWAGFRISGFKASLFQRE